jgi:D-alanine-D-alanine ligase
MEKLLQMNLFSNRGILYSKNPFVWAFIPESSDEDPFPDEAAYDSHTYKFELARAFQALNLAWVWQPVNLRNLHSIVQQVSECMASRETLVFNLCDGAETDGRPGLSVIELLQDKHIPFTGAHACFYAVTTSKITMKKHLVQAGVPTPRFAEIPRDGPVKEVCANMETPLIVKPAISAGSHGIFLRSVVDNDGDLEAIRDELVHGEFAQFHADIDVFAEAFVRGPEFTVFLLGDWDRPDSVQVLPPIQRVFDASIPEGKRFFYYDFYWAVYKEDASPLTDEPYHYELVSGELKTALSDLAIRAYCAVKGTGYGRVDIRMDQRHESLYVLEVNSNCGLSSDEQSSVGKILELSGYSFVDLIGEILCQPLLPSYSSRGNDEDLRPGR